MGDVNAKAREWGSPYTDRRGEELVEFLATRDMVVHNVGTAPTFSSHIGKSHIDLTSSTGRVARKILAWRLHPDEVLSDHAPITFEVRQGGKRRERGATTFINLSVFRSHVREAFAQDYSPPQILPEACTRLLQKAHKNCTSRLNRPDKRFPYWWTEDIEANWTSCNQLRTKLHRARARGLARTSLVITLEAQYKMQRRTLRKDISRAKRARWRILCDALEEDI